MPNNNNNNKITVLAPASCTKKKKEQVAIGDLELQKPYQGARKITQQVKELAANSDDWSSIPESHMLEGESWFPGVVLCPAQWY